MWAVLLSLIHRSLVLGSGLSLTGCSRIYAQLSDTQGKRRQEGEGHAIGAGSRRNDAVSLATKTRPPYQQGNVRAGSLPLCESQELEWEPHSRPFLSIPAPFGGSFR